MIKIFIYGSAGEKDRLWTDARAEYLKRLSRTAQVTYKKLPDCLPTGSIGLLTTGEALSSPELARLIREKLQLGNALHFVTGDAARACDRKIQLTSLPLSPELESVLLLEQIYRAFKILSGEPYHK